MQGDANVDTDLVVGIDFGSSSSGYAYAFRGTSGGSVYYENIWPDQPIVWPKTETAILFSPDDEKLEWGSAARSTYYHLMHKQQAKGNVLYNFFKMKLYESRGKGIDLRTVQVSSSDGSRSLPLRQLVSEYLLSVKEYALKKIVGGTTSTIQAERVFWVLSVPAIWTDAEKQFMRECAQQAGLIGPDEASQRRLAILYEPEAAAIHCQLEGAIKLHEQPAGTRFMVVDAGGGTVDITAYEITSERLLRELTRGRGGPFGSGKIDEQFKKYFISKVSDKALLHFLEQKPAEYLKQMARWEQAKCSYMPGKDVFIEFSRGLELILRSSFPEIASRLTEQQKGEDSGLLLAPEVMQSFFEPVLEGIGQEMAAMMSSISGQRCSYIILVGGFARSPVLQDHLRTHFESNQTRLIVPADPERAVLGGTVHYGLDPSIIRSRRTRLTYGCRCEEPFENGKDFPHKRVPNKDRQKDFTKDRFSKFVTAGDSVAVEESVTNVYNPIASDQTRMNLDFFATQKKEVRYVDEDEVWPIGSVHVDMPDTTGGVNRRVEVTMYFGRSEIKVQARDLTSGRDVSAKLEFLSTYLQDDAASSQQSNLVTDPTNAAGVSATTTARAETGT